MKTFFGFLGILSAILLYPHSAAADVGQAEIMAEPASAVEPGSSAGTASSFGSTDVMSMDPLSTDASAEVAAVDPAVTSGSTRANVGAGSGSGATSSSEVSTNVDDYSEGPAGSFNGNFYSIFYGPSLGNPNYYQPRPDGTLNKERPVEAKNYLALTYNVTNEIAVTPTFHWSMKPIQGKGFNVEDPFLRISHSKLVEQGPFNVYADARFHFPVSEVSRINQQVLGTQLFQVSTLDIPTSRFTFALDTSERVNFIRKGGFGYDLELYAGPNISYSFSSKFAVKVLYEMGASHQFGKGFGLSNDGTDLEPGVLWEVQPNFLVNPYFHFNTGESISMDNTSVGAIVTWTMF